MDSLINAINSFKILENKSEEIFDDLISKMEILDTSDSEIEWDVLKSNYSKLRYLNHLIDNYVFPETKKFSRILISILNGIDSMTQYYLKELDWDSEENMKEECLETKVLFEKSLNIYFPIEKLKTILLAYDIFIPIIESFRKERFVDLVDDQPFLEITGSLIKKRKRSF